MESNQKPQGQSRVGAVSRRQLLEGAAILAGGAAQARPRSAASYVDTLRPPDLIDAFLEGETVALAREGHRWTAPGIVVQADPEGSEIPVRVEAPQAPLLRIRLRWRARVPRTWRVLNDQWERSYGDLEWRGMVEGRILPWYFLAFDGRGTHGYGVATGASSMCFWQVDPEGISLWLDVRNGGSAVHLGPRILPAAVIRSRPGRNGESAFQAARSFCRLLCRNPRLPGAPVYGGNNWYYTYGENCSAAALIRDAEFVAGASPSGGNRPFMVMDEGWGTARYAGPWEHPNDRFPDMAGMTSQIKRLGVRPGIWIRPLYTAAAAPQSWRLRSGSAPAGKEARFATLDPSIPEVIETVCQDIRRLTAWGFELVKHDFTSFDILGRWGNAMNAELTDKGWHFADRSRTTAEIVIALYQAIREAAGDALLIGCNTFGHLGAGIFELQRIGDDTSGRDFNRTRLMGVNTLAFRGPQHGAFFAADADCAAITPLVPWSLSRLWLDLLATSGTPLFVSADPRAIGPEQKQALQRAYAQASTVLPLAEPVDWMDSTIPACWRAAGRSVEHDWYGAEGSSPFLR
jgi:alpha-galactosidase